MICQRCKQTTHDVQVYKTDLDDPNEVPLCSICKEVYETLPDGDGGEVVLYYPESPDAELIDLLIDEGLFRTPAAIARFLGHKSPSHIYRVQKVRGNLSERDRETLVTHWRATHQPSPVFAPKIIDARPDLKWLCLETAAGTEVRIPLELKAGKWVITSPAFDIFVKGQ